MHPEYQRLYWFKASGETSWEKPVDAAAQAQHAADQQAWDAAQAKHRADTAAWEQQKASGDFAGGPSAAPAGGGPPPLPVMTSAPPPLPTMPAGAVPPLPLMTSAPPPLPTMPSLPALPTSPSGHHQHGNSAANEAPLADDAYTSEILFAFYTRLDPSKLPNIPLMLTKFTASQMRAIMHEKYGECPPPPPGSLTRTGASSDSAGGVMRGCGGGRASGGAGGSGGGAGAASSSDDDMYPSDEDDPSPVTSVSVDRSATIKKGKITVYICTVTKRKQEWQIKKRFSDFEALFSKCSRECEDEGIAFPNKDKAYYLSFKGLSPMQVPQPTHLPAYPPACLFTCLPNH
jgi:hypothetical protein